MVFWLLNHVVYLKVSDRILIIGSCLVKLSTLVDTFKTFVHSGPKFLQNESSQFSRIYFSPEKLRQMFTFQFCKTSIFDQNTNFAKFQMPNGLFCIFVNNLRRYFVHLFEDVTKLIISYEIKPPLAPKNYIHCQFPLLYSFPPLIVFAAFAT